MKLRNKKTDEIKSIEEIIRDAFLSNELDSLKSIDTNWEDVDVTNATNIPLIKDEKIRKAVRSWAEANNVPNDVKLDVFEYLGTGTTAIRYRYKAKTLPHERCVQFEYISSDEIYTSQNNRDCTIAELCGEEEEW